MLNGRSLATVSDPIIYCTVAMQEFLSTEQICRLSFIISLEFLPALTVATLPHSCEASTTPSPAEDWAILVSTMAALEAAAAEVAIILLPEAFITFS